MLLMTETNLDVFHAQLLTPQDAPAMDQLCAACGTPGGPDTAALLQTNAVLGDYAGTDTLQAAMGMLPMFGQSRLALALRAAGFGADGPGHCAGTARLYRAVPAGAALFGHGAGAGQTALRQLPYLGRPAADPHPGRRGTMRPIFGIWPYPARRGAAGQPAAAGCLRPTPRWAAAARCAAYTCRTPPCRAFWSAAAPWQILAGINRALSSACGEWNKETDACRRFL